MALHSSAHRAIDYTAREERFKSVDTLLNHFLAVIDPKSGEVEVIQAKKMVVRGTVRSKQAPTEAMEVGAGKPVWLGLLNTPVPDLALTLCRLIPR
jgi:DNA-directed RNA polymerase I subunit RPA49